MAFLAAIPAALGIGGGAAAGAAGAASGLGGLGAAISAGGTLLGGLATMGQMNYQAEVAKNNATIASQNATAAEQAGEQQAAQESRKNAAQMGSIVASQAANGVDVNTGSAVDVQTSEREIGHLDTENVMRNAEMQAYGYRTQSTNYQAQAKLDSAAASLAPISAAFGATGSYLEKSSALGSNWTGMATS
jgi:hypothetical protein